MDIKRILLPYNFTNLDKKALEFVNQTFSHLKGVGVTLFNVYTSGQTFDTIFALTVNPIYSLSVPTENLELFACGSSNNGSHK